MKQYKICYWVVPETGHGFEYVGHIKAENEIEAATIAQNEVYALYSFAIECDLLSISSTESVNQKLDLR